MEHENTIRLSVFLGLFILFALCELVIPRRPLTARKSLRWLTNIMLTTINSIAVPLLIPVMAVGMAYKAEAESWGILNQLSLPPILAIVITIVVFDCLIYWQHVIFHKVPILWRLHRVHHSDVDLDVTSGARFHTIEILLSMLIKLAAVCLIGPPVMGVLLFEVILNGTAMFNHSNLKLPLKLDMVLRKFLVTPDMHRVHHSVHRDETDSNYGFNLPWWDYLFQTYTDQPRDGHDGMTIGLKDFRDTREQFIDRLLVQPLKNPDKESAETTEED